MTGRALFLVRSVVGGLLLGGNLGVEVSAQLREPAPTPVVITRPPALRTWAPPEPLPRRFGIVTFDVPDTRGAMVKVSIPVGDVIVRVSNRVAAARQRHRAAAARTDVQRAHAAFLRGQPLKVTGSRQDDTGGAINDGAGGPSSAMPDQRGDLDVCRSGCPPSSR